MLRTMPQTADKEFRSDSKASALGYRWHSYWFKQHREGI